MVLGPGGVTRPVRHRTVEGIWYVISGAGEVWIDNALRQIEAGSSVIIPAGAAFQFRTLGDEPLRFLCFTSPPWPGDDEAIPVPDGGLGQPTV